MQSCNSSKTSINPCTNSATIHGIILRASASLCSRYIYVPFPRPFPSASDSDSSTAFFSDALTAIPHFPHITILDSIACNILYQTHTSHPDLFHVYNLINRAHFHFRFPHPFTHVNAAIAMHERIYFKVLVVSVEERQNGLFCKDSNSAMPLVFYVYSSKSKAWSLVRSPAPILTAGQLIPNRRKPIHADVDAVFIDLTDRFLVHFGSMFGRVDLVPKPVSPWEISDGSMKLDGATRYGECNGWIQCVKINPLNGVAEVWRMEALIGVWGLVVAGKKMEVRGKVLGLHPYVEGSVFMRSKDYDEILLVDMRRDLKWVVVGGRGPECGEVCFLRGARGVFEAALGGGGMLQASGCGVLHPHENVDGPEGEIFIVSTSEMNLTLH